MDIVVLCFFTVPLLGVLSSWRRPGVWLSAAVRAGAAGRGEDHPTAAASAAGVCWGAISLWLFSAGVVVLKRSGGEGHCCDSPWQWSAVALLATAGLAGLVGVVVWLFMRPRLLVPVPLRGATGLLAHLLSPGPRA